MTNEVTLTDTDGKAVTLDTIEQIEAFMRKAQQDIARFPDHYEKHGALNDSSVDHCAILVERWNSNAQALERFNAKNAADRVLQTVKAARDIVDQKI